MEWTADQEAAISARGTDLLVSAAAGSGKTAVLVERILRLIDGGADVDDFLIVTFSRAAANDMKGKLTSRLEARAAAEPRFRAQLDHLERASISTIHAFCIDVLREHFEAAGVDPAFRVLDGPEEAILAGRAMAETLEALYEANDARLDGLRYGRDAKKLGEIVRALYAFSRERADSGAWLDGALTNLPPDGAIWIDRLSREARAVVGEARALLLVALGLAEGPLGPAKYAQAIADDIGRLDALCDCGYDDLREGVRAFALTRLPGVRVSEDDPDYEARMLLKEQISALRAAVKKSVTDLANKLIERAGALSDMAQDAPALCLLREAVADFGARLYALKAERSALTFNDLEHAALTALADEGAAQSLRARYAYVFVDEYQDVSDLQEAVLRRVARPDALFMVGDVKQSIYRFRQAEPTLFIDKYARFGRGEGGRLVTLGRNFRSREGVLAFVNRVFERAMDGPDAEIHYDAQARLTPGAAYPGIDPPVELHIIASGEPAADEPDADEAGAGEADADADLTALAREAALAARRIAELIGTPFHPSPDAPERPLRPGDFAVLCRTGEGVLAAEQALRGAGIPCFADVREGYFGALETRIARSLLQLIENRRRDFPLVEVLRSPIVGLTSAQMAAIRAHHGEGSYRDACLAYMEKDDELARTLAAFEDRLDRWRMLSTAIPLPEWMGLVLDESGYYAYAGAMPGGAQRRSNLDALCAYAVDYADTQSGALTGFLTYLNEIEQSGNDAGAPCQLPGGADVVRAMTAHKSKGLEFPVVLCLQMGRSVRGKRQTGEPAAHRALGAGLFHFDGELGTRRDTLSRLAIAAANADEALEEEKRVLYVLLTRAKDRLILIGTLRKKRPVTEARWAAARIASIRPDSFFDMVMPAVTDADAVRFTGAAAPRAPADAPKEDARIDERAVERFKAAFTWRYPYEGEAFVPLKLTASGLTRTLTGATARTEIVRRPRFLQGEARTGAERGTLYHQLLSALDLGALKELSGEALTSAIGAQAERLIASGRLAAPVGIGPVAAFFARGIGRRLLAATEVRREWPFNLRMPAREALDMDVDARVTVQGVIDCCFLEDGQWVLLDYKTDRLDDEEALVSRYRAQLALYRRALTRITGLPVRQTLLCLLGAGREIGMDD